MLYKDRRRYLRSAEVEFFVCLYCLGLTKAALRGCVIKKLNSWITLFPIVIALMFHDPPAPAFHHLLGPRPLCFHVSGISVGGTTILQFHAFICNFQF